MNITDTGKPTCRLHPSEVERLLSWLRCNPVVGRENERKSLEHILAMVLQLSGHDMHGYESSLLPQKHTCQTAPSAYVPYSDGPCVACAEEKIFSCPTCGSQKRDGYISYDALGRSECADLWHGVQP
jgi:hypothetical protein